LLATCIGAVIVAVVSNIGQSVLDMLNRVHF
jgi:Flp pilus assembly pilin Flp